VGQAVKFPRIKGADKIIATPCGEHEAEGQKIKNWQGLSQREMTRTAARLTTALGAEAGPNLIGFSGIENRGLSGVSICGIN